MISLKKLAIPVTLFIMTLAVVSCNNTKSSEEVAEDINEEKFDDKKVEKDADRLVEAYASNLFEIKFAQSAAVNSVSDEVKKLSAMLVEAHTMLNTDIEALATKKQVTLPNDISVDQKSDIEKMAEKKGIDYDKAFVDKMKSKHEDAIDFYEKTANKATDTEIKMWATITAPEIRSHLDMVLMAQNAIKDKK